MAVPRIIQRLAYLGLVISLAGASAVVAQTYNCSAGNGLCGVVSKQFSAQYYGFGYYYYYFAYTPAAGYSVKACQSSSGTGFCFSASTDSYGRFYMQGVNSYPGYWWIFASNSSENWGSDNQPTLANNPIWVPSYPQYVDAGNIITPPRPTGPQPVYPPDNGWHIPYNTGFYLTWSAEPDASRVNPSWPITYDFWENSWFKPLERVFTDLQSNYLYIGWNWLAPCSWYSTMEEAKMNVGSSSGGSPYYNTQGSVATWATNGPGC